MFIVFFEKCLVSVPRYVRYSNTLITIIVTYNFLWAVNKLQNKFQKKNWMGESNPPPSEGSGRSTHTTLDWPGRVARVSLTTGLYTSCSVSYFAGVMSQKVVYISPSCLCCSPTTTTCTKPSLPPPRCPACSLHPFQVMLPLKPPLPHPPTRSPYSAA